MEIINIKEKLAKIHEHYVPKIVGELNGQYVKLVKFKGPYVTHKHDNEDELFYVLNGSFDMEYEDKTVTINKGEFVIVPRGVYHRPIAEEEVAVLLFEPATVVNTGEVESKYTLKPDELEKI